MSQLKSTKIFLIGQMDFKHVQFIRVCLNVQFYQYCFQFQSRQWNLCEASLFIRIAQQKELMWHWNASSFVCNDRSSSCVFIDTELCETWAESLFFSVIKRLAAACVCQVTLFNEALVWVRTQMCTQMCSFALNEIRISDCFGFLIFVLHESLWDTLITVDDTVHLIGWSSVTLTLMPLTNIRRSHTLPESSACFVFF